MSSPTGRGEDDLSHELQGLREQTQLMATDLPSLQTQISALRVRFLRLFIDSDYNIGDF